jgi:hypothetical protein
VTFSESMDTNSVTTNLSLTCDGGAIQVSTDSFSTCILMNSSLTVSNSNKTFAVTPIKPILMRNNFPLTYYLNPAIAHLDCISPVFWQGLFWTRSESQLSITCTRKILF